MFKWINTIIFDLEWVIIDTKDIWMKTDKIFFSNKWIKYDISIKNEVVGKKIEETVKYYKDSFYLKEDLNDLIEEYTSIIFELFQSDIEYINGFSKFYETIKNNFNICIATSLDKKLLGIVDTKLWLNEKFWNKIYSSSEYNLSWVNKESIFDFAVKKMNTNYSSCLIIEDSPIGLSSARNLGIKCFALETNFCWDELRYYTSYIFKDFIDIINTYKINIE